MLPEQLSFREVFHDLPGNGWLSEAEAELLWRYAICATGAILEVGCYHGRSTCLLAAFGRPVYSVDPFGNFCTEDLDGAKAEASWHHNVVSRGLTNVTLYRQTIEEWPVQPVGLAYLDGDHSYQGTINQIHKALAAEASVIAIHDVNDSGQGRYIRRAALTLLGPWLERNERLAVWLRKQEK